MNEILIPIIVGVAALALGVLIGFLIRKKIGEAKIGSAEVEAKRILEEGTKNAEAKKKEAILEAKEETLRLRNETERELKERRNEVSRQERRINQKEENLDRKTEAIEKKEEAQGLGGAFRDIIKPGDQQSGKAAAIAHTNRAVLSSSFTPLSLSIKLRFLIS